MNQYKEAVIKKLLKKSYSDLSLANTGTYLSVLTNDCERIQENYLKKIFDVIEYTLMFFGSFGLMLYYSPLLTLAAVVISLIPMASSIALSQGIAQQEEKVSKVNESYVALTKDVLSGLSVVKSFKAEPEVTNIYQGMSQELEETKKKREKVLTVVSAMGTLSGLVAQFGVLLVGAFLVKAQSSTLTAGMVLAFTNLMNSVLQPIAALPPMLGEMAGAKKLIGKMVGYMDQAKEDGGLAIAHSLQEGIDIKKVSFAYDQEHYALKDVDVNLEAGKAYAIVGPSGLGKTSLLNLLMGYYPGYKGSVQIDHQELSQINKNSLYDKMTLIQQSVFIFDASVWDNITLFKEFPEEEVKRVIRLAGLEQLLEEKGKDYACGENGNHLSGGEKQRIAIARSLLKQSEILLVDEATSALDNVTSANVTQSILDLKGILRLVITHRLEANALRQYDEILVMKDGQLIEKGHFDQLMAQKDYFYSLYTITGSESSR